MPVAANRQRMLPPGVRCKELPELEQIESARSEPIGGVLSGDSGQGGGDGRLEFLAGAGFGTA